MRAYGVVCSTERAKHPPAYFTECSEAIVT